MDEEVCNGWKGKCKTHLVPLDSRSACLKRLKEANRGGMPDIRNW
jgi:hypothetical protein